MIHKRVSARSIICEGIVAGLPVSTMIDNVLNVIPHSKVNEAHIKTHVNTLHREGTISDEQKSQYVGGRGRPRLVDIVEVEPEKPKKKNGKKKKKNPKLEKEVIAIDKETKKKKKKKKKPQSIDDKANKANKKKRLKNKLKKLKNVKS